MLWCVMKGVKDIIFCCGGQVLHRYYKYLVPTATIPKIFLSHAMSILYNYKWCNNNNKFIILLKMVSREIVYKPFFRSNPWHARRWVQESWIASMPFKVVLLKNYIIKHFWIFGQEHTHHIPIASGRRSRESRSLVRGTRMCNQCARRVTSFRFRSYTHDYIRMYLRIYTSFIVNNKAATAF